MEYTLGQKERTVQTNPSQTLNALRQVRGSFHYIQ